MGTIMIRPGFLVALHSKVQGGVKYERTELEHEKSEDGEERQKWTTERVTADADEHERALLTRNKARGLIAAQCTPTSFGLVCRLDRELQLDEAVAKARELVRAFNATAVHTRVAVFSIKGQIATTDAEAARGIAGQVSELVDNMGKAIDSLDPEAIRKAADEARRLSELLSDEDKAKVSEAIRQARKAARVIVSRIQKKGEDAAIVAKDIQRGSIEKARIAFLDMDDDAPAVAPGEELPAVQTREIDLDDDPEPDSEEPVESEPSLEAPAPTEGGPVETVAAASAAPETWS